MLSCPAVFGKHCFLSKPSPVALRISPPSLLQRLLSPEGKGEMYVTFRAVKSRGLFSALLLDEGAKGFSDEDEEIMSSTEIAILHWESFYYGVQLADNSM